MAMIRRYGGFKEESEYGGGGSPDFYVDIGSASLDAPTDSVLVYQGGLSRGARKTRPGFYSPSGSITYATDIKTIAYILSWALGGYKFTDGGGEGDKNLHEIYSSDDLELPSFCAKIGKDVFEHEFRGCVVNSLSLSVGDWCEAEVSIQAQKDYKNDLKDLEDVIADLPDEYPLSFQDVSLKIDDSEEECKVTSLTLNIDNNVDAQRCIGKRYPKRIPASEREVSLEMELYFDDTDKLESFWGSTSGVSDDGGDEVKLQIDVDSGDYGSMEILMAKAEYMSVAQQPSGRDAISQTITARAFLDTIEIDDGSEVDSEVLVSIENNEGEL